MSDKKGDPGYPAVDLSPKALDRAMIRGRGLRSRAFHDLAIGFYNWLAAPRRPSDL
jgi:hypothetical protein